MDQEHPYHPAVDSTTEGPAEVVPSARESTTTQVEKGLNKISKEAATGRTPALCHRLSFMVIGMLLWHSLLPWFRFPSFPVWDWLDLLRVMTETTVISLNSGTRNSKDQPLSPWSKVILSFPFLLKQSDAFSLTQVQILKQSAHNIDLKTQPIHEVQPLVHPNDLWKHKQRKNFVKPQWEHLYWTTVFQNCVAHSQALL